jgi:Xaa-Pro aminopeptidase
MIEGDASVTLASDVPLGHDDAAADLVLVTDDLVSTVAERLGPRVGDRPWGIVGGDSMPSPHRIRLHELLPTLDLMAADDVVRRERLIKSDAEQELIRQAGALGTSAMASAMSCVGEGVDEATIAAAAARTITAGGGVIYNMFADSWGASRGHVRRRMPTWVAGDPLRSRESFAIGMSGALKGYLFDFARTMRVGQESHPLYAIARGTVETVLERMRPGVTVGEAVRAGLTVLEDAGFANASTSFNALGHGLGLGWEEPWLFPDESTVLQPGMYLAIEKDLWTDDDGAAFEVDVLITDDGVEVVTPAP